MAIDREKRLDAAAERAKELYKYFQPQTFIAEHAFGQPRSTDPLLTSQAQLVALRLNARRCTISFLDHDTQYNVAEATQTTHMDDTSKYDAAQDGLWKGCSSFSSESSMCLHALVAQPDARGEPPCFEVLDAGKDPRFAHLPVVNDYPYIKYYYGAPMHTSRGVVIGTLCVLDDKVRSPMSIAEKQFMAAVAKNIIRYMELLRDRAEQQRSLYMSKCLAAFVDPDHTPVHVNGQPVHTLSGPKTPTSTVPPAVTSLSPAATTTTALTSPHSPRPPSRPRLQRKGSSMRTYEGSADGAGRRRALSVNKQLQHQLHTFQYAANLLKESVSGGAGASVVIYDTAIASPRRGSGVTVQATAAEPTSDDDWNSDSAATHRSNLLGGRTTSASWSSHLSDYADVLAFSEPEVQDRAADTGKVDNSERTFQPMALKRLAQLVERHPRGKFWTFASDGQPYSESSDDSHDDSASPRDPVAAEIDMDQAEVSLLQSHFPNALQVIFVPFWDLRCTRWCAAFVTNSSPYRTFTSHADFLYVIAFCNCIAIELARAATAASDQQKSDFIGSISHELRSPLHGIMASCEFLQDTETSTFQQSLLDTVDSCARTLLDTISMVLDYSKINTFERDWRTAQRPKRGGGKVRTDGISRRSASLPDVQPTMNIYGNIDLGGVTEEVVEGAVTGHAVQSLSSKLGFDVGVAGSTRAAPLQPPSTTTTAPESQHAHTPVDSTDSVEVVLDIAAREWSYVTQPGAFRRIVMNLVGNALKYTSQGWIKVKLSVVEEDNTKPDEAKGLTTHDEHRDIVELSVTDTGKGISQEYLRSKLFTPFSQEDQLAPGTGLGLSLVKSIVNLLEGEIEVQSTLNMGTKVTVRIPMIPQGAPNGSPHGSSGSSSENSGTVQARLESIRAVRTHSRGKEILLFAAVSPDTTHSSLSHERVRLQRESLKKYLVNWYGIRIASHNTVTTTTDVVVVDEADLDLVVSSTPSHTFPLPVLVLCSNSTRHKYMSEPKYNHFDFISKPFGPYRLAKALHRCLQKSGRSTAESHLRSTGSDSVEGLSADVEKVTLASDEGNIPVLRSRGVLGNQQSPNAQMAMSRGTPDDAKESRNPLSARIDQPGNGKEKNPFDEALSSITRVTSPVPPSRPPLTTRKTLSPTTTEIEVTSIATAAAATATATSQHGVAATLDRPDAPSLTKIPSAAPARSPRILLVDDNAINLRLLQTFMHKRQYTFVHSASDGAEAVERFAAAAEQNTPYDVVFMDISMPVMNGFEATQRIRAIEDGRGLHTSAMEMPAPALVIALTGLASGRDQSEAFVAGVDLYMTKPVSFREIARLLDNWEANGGTASGDTVPHGAVSAADVQDAS